MASTLPTKNLQKPSGESSTVVQHPSSFGTSSVPARTIVAIIEVEYVRLNMASNLVRFHTEEELTSRLDSLIANPQVKRIRIFRPEQCLTKETSWRAD